MKKSESIFKLERYFTPSARHALISAEKVHKELLNKRLISPHEFWGQYYETVSSDMTEPARAANEIINFREKPKHLWYSSQKNRIMQSNYDIALNIFDT